jgi:hypothetical protein
VEDDDHGEEEECVMTDDPSHVDYVDPDAEALVAAADAGSPDLAALADAYVSRLAGSKAPADRAVASELRRRSSDPADFVRRVLVLARRRHEESSAHADRRGREARLAAFGRSFGF